MAQERFEQEITAVGAVRVRGRSSIPAVEELTLSAGAIVIGVVIGFLSRAVF